jgi:predicted house-cleaning noncanonical NTP pyrophosphatase (MazG superfamily)
MGVIYYKMINIEVNQAEIREYINRKLNEEIKETLWLVDVEKIVELTCMSKRFLEDTILSDVRMRAIERRKNKKRWYPAKQAFEVIEEITLEW